MFRLTHTITRAASVGLGMTLAACQASTDAIAPPVPNADIFRSYVALGNSITAGFQSGGINDSTQRQSYAFLLAGQMGTQFHYPSLAMPGCPPPMVNALTGARLGGSAAPVCSLRNASSIVEVLNSVAVPDARVLDPISRSTVASNALTTLILGGKTQVEKALQAHPTFATIWIGNNDVLAAGVTGLLTPVPGISPGIVSTEAQFESSYDAMIKQLVDSAPGIKGVLIGVVKVSGIPILSAGDTVYKSAATRAFLNAATGKAVTIDANCSGSTSLLAISLLAQNIRSGALPPYISCVPDSPAPGLGRVFVLDPGEQVTLNSVIDGYNAYIANKATAIGFAFLDPNPLLAAQRATNAIPRLPNFTASTASTSLYGPLISLDGVHPAAAAHVAIANAIISVINSKYATTLAPIQ